jgi:adenylyltransferase/sulfurtransferase
VTDPGRYAIIERVSALASVDYSTLGSRRVVVVGCGALGSAVAMLLVRSGVGAVRLVDRDVVELRNLAVQLLYTEQDAALGLPKAEAAQTQLRKLNAGCEVDGIVADFAPGNARQLVDGADLIVDGVDNLETKLLLNDVAIAEGIPLVYAGCAGAEGSVLAIVPGVTHCLRCLWPQPSAAAARLSCQTHGLLPATATGIAALQFTEAMKLLLGLGPQTLSGLVRIDVWHAVSRRVPLPAFDSARRDCPACGAHDFSYLRGEHQTVARELCGDDTVLLCSPNGCTDLTRLTERHRRNGTLRALPNCVQLEVEGVRILAFASGRTLIHGAGGLNQAKSLYARQVLG